MTCLWRPSSWPHAVIVASSLLGQGCQAQALSPERDASADPDAFTPEVGSPAEAGGSTMFDATSASQADAGAGDVADAADVGVVVDASDGADATDPADASAAADAADVSDESDPASAADAADTGDAVLVSDPLSISILGPMFPLVPGGVLTMTLEAACGATPPPNSFAITNVSNSPVTWSLGSWSNLSSTLTVSPTGSTLAPGAVVTVNVTSQAIPQYPPNVGVLSGGGMDVISTLGGQPFDDKVTVEFLVDGCMGTIMPTGPVDFGEVPVGSTSASSVVTSFNGSCFGVPGEGHEDNAADLDPDFRVTGARPNYTIVFQPLSPGLKTTELSIGYIAPELPGACQPPPTLVLTGTGVAVDGGPDATP